MESLIKFRDVALFKDQPFGISGVSFDITFKRRVHLELETQAQLNTLAGILEGRYQEDSGIVYRQRPLFIQSDRQLLGDKIYDRPVDKWLQLADERFFYGGRQRLKRTFLETLQAKHLHHFQIYRLRGEDRIKFALLSLTFQETGLILISRLLTQPLNERMRDHLIDLIIASECTVCLLTSRDTPIDTFRSLLDEEDKIRRIRLPPTTADH
jgi:hypothetical protein